MKFSDTNLLKVLSLGKSLKRREIDSLVFYTVDILETKFGKTTLQRHLTTFETNFLAIT